MTIREREFVEAAKAVGASDKSIIFQQILPNAMAPLIVEVTMAIAGAILSIAGAIFPGTWNSGTDTGMGRDADQCTGGISAMHGILPYSRIDHTSYDSGTEHYR